MGEVSSSFEPAESSNSLIARKVSLSFEERSGLLPDAETLGKYEKLVPGSAKLVFEVFANQVDHRIDIEKTVIKGQTKQSAHGQIYALIVALALIVLAGYFLRQGHPNWGGGIVIGTVVSSIGLFITGKYRIFSDLKNKKKELPEKNIPSSKT